MIRTNGLNIYQIEVIETMSALVEVVAEDGATALLKAREKYRSENITLEPDEMLDTQFIIFGVE